MVYYGEFIESDTSMIDPSQVLDVPFTITYHVNILQNGIEDFAPFIMYFAGGNDAAGGGGVGMRSEEHTSEPVTNAHLVCRLLLETKKRNEDNSAQRLRLLRTNN